VRNELLERDILVGTSADPHIIRLLPSLITEEQHFTKLVETLAILPSQ
jgi:4-aminobutyrate aminotransferase-like enzyme